MTHTAPLLAARDLALTVGDFTLGPLSLSLAAHDYLVLLGPSGCGKTTLLRCIAGAHVPETGAVCMRDEDVTDRAPHHRHVSYVAQTSDLFPHRDVAANIRFGLRYVKAPADEKRARFERIADLLRLRPLLARRVQTLSGGESKRVALARGLVVRPRVLLLDEPLSMLDPNARAAILDILRTIHGELGTATVHVTHDREEAWALGGRCAVMRDGRIEQAGDVQTLFRRPRTPFVAEFLGGANVLPARFERRGHRTLAVLPWAEFELADRPDADAGHILIRPETLTPSNAAARNAVAGTLRAVSDRGIYAELAVAVAPNLTLIAHVPAARAGGLTAGGPITLRCTEPPHAMADDKGADHA